MVNVSPHRRRPPCPPRPDRWRHVIDDRDRAVEPVRVARDAKRKRRAVDNHQGMRVLRQDRPNCLHHVPDDARQPSWDGSKTDDGKIADGKQAVETRGGHLGAADAGKPHRRRGTLPQRLHQRGTEPISGFLGGDQENLQFARRQFSRRPGRCSGHRTVPSAPTPITKILAPSAAAAIRSGSATMVDPATTAIPARPAALTAPTVGGPITGRSMR